MSGQALALQEPADQFKLAGSTARAGQAPRTVAGGKSATARKAKPQAVGFDDFENFS